MSNNPIFALCQMKVIDNKKANIQKALGMINQAADSGAALAILPEIWNCSYSTSLFAQNAEQISDFQLGESLYSICDVAAKRGLYIVAGSIPEIAAEDDEKICYYNTSVTFDPTGKMIVKYRKKHLFNIDIKDKITFRESDVLSAGNEIVTFDSTFGKIGVAICFDIRFPSHFSKMREAGADIFVVPGNFNMTTGPLHWELLQRARAVDNQTFVVTCAGARDEAASYVTYSNSSVVNPWGEVIANAGIGEKVELCEIDTNICIDARRQIPLFE